MPVDVAQDASVEVAEPAIVEGRPADEAAPGVEASAIALAADALTRAWRSSGPVEAAGSAVALAPPPMARAPRAEVDRSAMDQPVALDVPAALDHPGEVDPSRVDAPVLEGAAAAESLPVGADQTSSPEWRVDATRLPDDDASSPVAPPVYRPRRARFSVVLLLLLIAFGALATIYLMDHPDALSQLSFNRDNAAAGESAAPPATTATTAAQPDSETSDSTATSAAAAPTGTIAPRSAASTPTEAAPDAFAPTTVSPATAPSSTIDPVITLQLPTTAPPATTAPSQAAPVVSSSITPGFTPEAQDVQRDVRSSAPTTTRRAARSRNEPRGEARTSPPVSQREAPAPAPASPAVTCTPAVAALGLCNP